jgi:hypothetical protein
MDFWLKKGVDGFRQDVINLISKTPGLPDAPITFPDQFLQPAYPLFSNGPRLHEFLKEMRTAVLSRYDTMTVGQMPWCTDKEEVLRCVGEDRGELDMIFEFDIIEMDFGPAGRFTDASEPWSLKTLRDIIEGWQTFMIQNSGWNSIASSKRPVPSLPRQLLEAETSSSPYQPLKAVLLNLLLTPLPQSLRQLIILGIFTRFLVPPSLLRQPSNRNIVTTILHRHRGTEQLVKRTLLKRRSKALHSANTQSHNPTLSHKRIIKIRHNDTRMARNTRNLGIPSSKLLSVENICQLCNSISSPSRATLELRSKLIHLLRMIGGGDIDAASSNVVSKGGEVDDSSSSRDSR